MTDAHIEEVDALRHQLDLSAAIIGHLGEGVYALDLEGRVTYMNPAAEQLLGWTEAELLGRDMHQIIHFQRPDGSPLPVAECPLLDVIRGGCTIRNSDDVFIRKNGSRLPVSFVSAPILREGRSIGAVLAFHDISERKQTEAARTLLLAREHEARQRAEVLARERDEARAEAEAERARLHSLLMQAPVRIAVARGPEHVYEFANQLYVRSLGNRGPVLGRRAADVFPEAVGQGIIAQVDRVYQTGEPFLGIEQPFVLDYDGDGQPEVGYANVSIQPIRTSDGTVDGVMLVSIGVTEQVLARRHIEQLAAERTAILGQMTEGLLLADTEGIVNFVNRTAAALYGVDAIGIGPESYAEVFNVRTLDGAPISRADSPLARAAIDGETIINDEAVISRPDGRTIVISRSAAPVLAEDGTRLGAVMAVRDITEQRRLEQQKNDFLAAAAHDLKTPLTTIKGLSQMVYRQVGRLDTPLTGRILENLERIDGATSRMNRLVDELLDSTRMHMGHTIELKRRPTDLVALARQGVAEARRSSFAHHLALQSPDGAVTGEWDAARLERVIANLLSNAIKYSPGGGAITVTVRHAGGNALLSVRDEGVGIAPADLPHIFDQFYRARNVEGMLPGTGIGLAGARRIVEQHGGTIEVESTPGVGSTFTVRLPLQPPN